MKPKPFQVDRARVSVKRGPRADGRYYWRARLQDGSERRDLWSGWATRDEAGAAVREALSFDAAPAEELRTVRDVLECWVAAVEARLDVSAATRRNARHAAVRLLRHELGRVPVGVVGRHHLEAHRDAALASGLVGSSVRRDLHHLAQAWRWAQEVGAISVRPLPRVPVQRSEPRTTRYTPTADEVGQILSGLGERARRAVVLLASTGCRVGEIVSLTWAQVPIDGSRIRVRGKTGERWVTLPSAVGAELLSWGRGAPFDLVVGVSAVFVRRHLAARCEELGLPRLSPNGLRRHVVDALYRTGRVDAAASQLGHSAVMALKIYRQVSEDDRRSAVEAAGLGVVVALPGRKDGTTTG